MANVTHNTQVTAQGIGRLLQMFKDKPRIAALLSAYLDEFQEREDAAYALYVGRLLQNNPTGDLLAKIGALVGQGSEGLTDPQFQQLIQARIRVNRSTGRREELIRIASILAPGDIVRARAFPPKYIMIQPDAALTLPPVLVGRRFMGPAAGAGTMMAFVWSSVPRAQTLVFGSVNGAVPVPTSSQVPGSVNGSVPHGGQTASVLQTNGGP